MADEEQRRRAERIGRALLSMPEGSRLHRRAGGGWSYVTPDGVPHGPHPDIEDAIGERGEWRPRWEAGEVAAPAAVGPAGESAAPMNLYVVTEVRGEVANHVAVIARDAKEAQRLVRDASGREHSPYFVNTAQVGHGIWPCGDPRVLQETCPLDSSWRLHAFRLAGLAP